MNDAHMGQRGQSGEYQRREQDLTQVGGKDLVLRPGHPAVMIRQLQRKNSS